MIKTTWEGLLFPTRLLTKKEIELLSPRCYTCGLSAYVVESKQPYTKKLARTRLIDLASETLRFYCAHHSPTAVDSEIEKKTNFDFYVSVRIPIQCPEQRFQRYANICLALQPGCVKRCKPIQDLIRENTLTLKEIKCIVTEGREYEKQQRHNKIK